MPFRARFYPEREGYEDQNGVPYPVLPEGKTRPELDEYLGFVREVCHEKGYNLSITSLNHGQHCNHSMHESGLAVDFNLFTLNASRPIREIEWVDFQKQGEVAIEAAKRCNCSIWTWPNDASTHSHVSIHP